MINEPTNVFTQFLINRGLEKDADFLTQEVRLLGQMLMENEVEQQVGAGKFERTSE